MLTCWPSCGVLATACGAGRVPALWWGGLPTPGAQGALLVELLKLLDLLDTGV